MGDAVALYAVITREGKIKRKAWKQGRGLLIYDAIGDAKRQCREGDSVVELYLNLDREPLFIREKKVTE
jgi:hypothetical protein